MYVSSNVGAGYIDVVYFATEKPIDACIEYVRPLGMYLFQHAGVRFDARTQISVDARLTYDTDMFESLGPTHVADYTRDDYARMQRVKDFPPEFEMADDSLHFKTDDERQDVYYRNSKYEVTTDQRFNPGYRALYSLQLCNNEHMVKSLIDPIFSLGYGPQSEDQTYSDEPYYITEDNVTVVNPKSYLVPPYSDMPPYNLRYDRMQELSVTTDVVTLDEDNNVGTIIHPKPAVNPIMATLGDAIEIEDTKHSVVSDEVEIEAKFDDE